ncbi:hypothetical protein L6R52_11660 [Myxococcota bacterium]|nr:hypothetical protein [Myxococcota bacterium]
MSEARPQSFLKRIARTLLLAAIGAFLGVQYARASLEPEILEGGSLLGMYAAAGSAVLILGARLVSLAGTLWRGLRGRDEPDEGEAPTEPEGPTDDDRARWERDRNDTR